MRALSYTQISTYQRCPLLYKLQYIDGLEPEVKWYFSFGKTLHRCVDYFFSAKSPTYPTLEQLLAFYEEKWVSDGWESTEKEATDKASGEIILREFWKIHSQDFKAPLATEHSFTVDMGGVELKGYVDHIDMLDTGGLSIVDYKSSQEVFTKQYLEDSLQLTLYQLACEQIWDMPVERLTLYHLRSNTPVSSEPRNRSQLEEARRLVLSVSEDIASGKFPPTRNRFCPCDFPEHCPHYNHKQDEAVPNTASPKSPPRCPKHDIPMVLRTARRGPHAGRQFYGCPEYPDCEEIVNLESVTPEFSAAEKRTSRRRQPGVQSSLPRTIAARARFHNCQVRFLESAVVPEDLLEIIDPEDAAQKTILRAYSQWRIDFPIGESASTMGESQRRLIAVAEKILTRGRITLASPKLERSIKQAFPEVSGDELSLALLESMALVSHENSPKHHWLDSREEEDFYSDILPEFLGQGYGRFVLPQMEFSSLCQPNPTATIAGYQRVDFAIFHPRLKERIVVEIDGKQHEQHIQADNERDRALQELGFTVVRIPASEIQARSGPRLSLLSSMLLPTTEKVDNGLDTSSGDAATLLRCMKLAHQIQVVLLQAIQSGFLNLEEIGSWHIVADLDELALISKKRSLSLLRESVVDFVELLARLGRLYSVTIGKGEPTYGLCSDDSKAGIANSINISFSNESTSDLPTFHVQSIYVPFGIANSSFPAKPVIRGLERPDDEDLKYFLTYLFRKEEFWEGQYDGITRVLEGKDTLILLPTGAGKSLIYQLASLLLPGDTIVVDPIISLMDDQIYNLAKIGIDRCNSITSESEDHPRVLQLLGQGEYLFTFVSPERFQKVEFLQALRSLTVSTPVALIVVDEAHCVSEWGHDFRTAYLNVGRIGRAYCGSEEYTPPMVGLTGTASRAVLKDVQRELQIDNPDAIITPESFDRPELKFDVIHSTSNEKYSILKGYLGQMLPSLFNVSSSALYQTRGRETYSGLVFCPWVNGEFGVVRVAEEISRDLGIHAAHYSGKAPRGWDDDEHRQYKRQTARDFRENRIPLLVCTSAFGMGIDKQNIRYSTHYGIPPSIEAFYQEAGRCGRDRSTAYCYTIVSDDDIRRTKQLLDESTAIEEIDDIVRNRTSFDDNDDITRNLFFHTRAFRGITQDKRAAEEVLTHLGDIGSKGKRNLTIPGTIMERVRKEAKDRGDVSGEARAVVEKALHRLSLVGVVSHYTIEYGNNEFTAEVAGLSKEGIIEAYGEYVSGFIGPLRREVEVQKARQFLNRELSGFISEMLGLLLQFIYSYIEIGRRKALAHMLECCQKKSDHEFREYLNLYWGRGDEFGDMLTEAIDEIRHANDAGICRAKGIIGDMESSREAAQIRGVMMRSLESWPDQPALLMLRAISEMYTTDMEPELAKQSFLASIDSARTNYAMSDTVVVEFASWSVSLIEKRDGILARELVVELLQRYSSRQAVRELVGQLPITLIDEPAWFLMARLQDSCCRLVSRSGR